MVFLFWVCVHTETGVVVEEVVVVTAGTQCLAVRVDEAGGAVLRAGYRNKLMVTIVSFVKKYKVSSAMAGREVFVLRRYPGWRVRSYLRGATWTYVILALTH